MISLPEERLLAACRSMNPDHYMVKFCDNPEDWYEAAERIAEDLELGGTPPLRILDIGCGFGYFLRACQQRGHIVEGIDLPDKVIQMAARVLGVTVHPYAVKAFTQLPERFVEYELITTFGVNFRREDDSYWETADYAFFAQDVLNRLTPEGQWIIHPNIKTRNPFVRYVFDVEEWADIISEFAITDVMGNRIIVTHKWESR